MKEDFAQSGPDADETNSAVTNGVEPVLDDLRTIMQLAGEQYHGELRIDTANEVADTVRFAQATMTWCERLTSTAVLEIHTVNGQLPLIRGQVLWATHQFLCLVDDLYEYLISARYVVMISGLPAYGVASTPSAVTERMDSIWLGGVLEVEQSATWYLASEHVLTGRCTRLGLDAVDVLSGSTSFTVLLEQLVAVRISN